MLKYDHKVWSMNRQHRHLQGGGLSEMQILCPAASPTPHTHFLNQSLLNKLSHSDSYSDKLWDALAYIKQVPGSEAKSTKCCQAPTVHQAHGRYVHVCCPHLTVNTGRFRHIVPAREMWKLNLREIQWPVCHLLCTQGCTVKSRPSGSKHKAVSNPDMATLKVLTTAQWLLFWEL